MEQYILKSDLVAEIKSRISNIEVSQKAGLIKKRSAEAKISLFKSILSLLNTIEVKDVNLIIHTIISECCDWLAMNTNLSHDEIEGCRNLMLTVKEEQLKV